MQFFELLSVEILEKNSWLGVNSQIKQLAVHKIRANSCERRKFVCQKNSNFVSLFALAPVAEKRRTSCKDALFFWLVSLDANSNVRKNMETVNIRLKDMKTMTLKLMGKKTGMTRLFDNKGNLVVCTVISVQPNVVAQIKRNETDGYQAVQLAAFKVTPPKLRNVSKALRGHYSKAGIEPARKLVETRVDDVEQYQLGQEVSVGVFAETAYVDVCSVSKGKGHQGVMKRHNFAGGPASHGSGFHRHGGSCGMRSSPGRCLPGQKKSGRMGGDRVTVENLKVVKIDEARNVLIVAGAVPGARDSFVYVTVAKKKLKKTSR